MMIRKLCFVPTTLEMDLCPKCESLAVYNFYAIPSGILLMYLIYLQNTFLILFLGMQIKCMQKFQKKSCWLRNLINNDSMIDMLDFD